MWPGRAPAKAFSYLLITFRIEVLGYEVLTLLEIFFTFCIFFIMNLDFLYYFFKLLELLTPLPTFL